MLTLRRAAALSIVLLPGMSATASASAMQETPFHFEVNEGQNINCFLRVGKTAAGGAIAALAFVSAQPKNLLPPQSWCLRYYPW